MDAIKQASRYWPGFAVITAIIGVLAAGGFLNPAAHSSDISTVNIRVEMMGDDIRELKSEHKELRKGFSDIKESLGRIEGKLDIKK